jgi:competence protein ComEA
MKRVWTGTAVALAVIGSGLILFAGGQRPEPDEGWKTLNRKVEQVMAVQPQQEQDEPERTAAVPRNPVLNGKDADNRGGYDVTQDNSGHAKGERAATAVSGQAERSMDGESADGVKRDGAQGSAATAVAGSESSRTVKQPTAADSSSATDVAGTNAMMSAASDSAASSASGGKMVNINTATADELMELPGVGAKRAEAILDYRNQHGPFKRVSDLDHVKGIGAKMLQKMKPYVSL